MTSTSRVAIFGMLGSGNLGNHGSLDAMLQYLRSAHPDAELSCVCAGPEEFERQYGIPATAMTWYHQHDKNRSRPVSAALKAFGKFADLFRTARWVRRYDVVIVPGMGVLEATLPLRPWGFPYALFLTALWGRLLGTKVALVSVGANVMPEPGTRWFVRQAGRLAYYRSFRDEPSRVALGEMGVDTSEDRVFPDLAFALPTGPAAPLQDKTVGVGVMAYYGTYADRHRADEIHAAYVGQLSVFVRWLVDSGYQVRLFTGDPADQVVVDEVTTAVGGTGLVAAKTDSLSQLMEQMSAVEVVVASRYHNVLSALKLGKPTISISYASKNTVLMADMGQDEFCQPIRELDADLLIEQFRRLQTGRDKIRRILLERCERNADLLAEQEAVLTDKLFHLPRSAARPV